MGYDCDMNGYFSFNKPVDSWLIDYLNRFFSVRHVRFNVRKIKESFPDWEKACYNGELGESGEFFAPGDENIPGEYIIDDDSCPKRIPYLWSPYVVSEDGLHLECRSGSAYSFLGWLAYYIKIFFEPNNLILNGSMEYEGNGDRGTVEINDNKISYSGPAIADQYRMSYNPAIIGYYEPYGQIDGGEAYFDVDEWQDTNERLRKSFLYKNMVESNAYVEALLVLDMEAPTTQDYIQLAKELDVNEYISCPISISKALSDIECKTTYGETVTLLEGKECLCIKCRFPDRITFENAKLLMPKEYAGVCYHFSDIKRYNNGTESNILKDINEGNVAVITDAAGWHNFNDDFDFIGDLSYKYQRTTFDFKMFSIECFHPMKIHVHKDEVIENTILVGTGSYYCWDDNPVQEVCDIGCKTANTSLEQEDLEVHNVGHAFMNAMRYLLSGTCSLPEINQDELWDEERRDEILSVFNNREDSSIGLKYDQHVDEITVAYSNFVIALEYATFGDFNGRIACALLDGSCVYHILDYYESEAFVDSLVEYAKTMAENN